MRGLEQSRPVLAAAPGAAPLSPPIGLILEVMACTQLRQCPSPAPVCLYYYSGLCHKTPRSIAML